MDLFTRSPQAAGAPITDSEAQQGPPSTLLPGPKSSSKHGPNAGVSDHYARILIGITATLLALSTLAILARLVTITITRRPGARKPSKPRQSLVRLDDVFSVLAHTLFIGFVATILTQSVEGLKPGVPNLTVMTKAKLANALLYLFCALAARLALLLFFRRVWGSGGRWFKWAWWALLVLATAQCVVFAIMELLACAPRSISEMWVHPYNCVQDRVPPVAGGVITVVEDLGIWVLATGMISRMCMDRRQKLAVAGVIGLGFVGVAFSICRAVVVARPEAFPASGIFLFILSSSIELAVIIICGCLLVLQPFHEELSNKVSPGITSKSRWPSSSDVWGSTSQVFESPSTVEAGRGINFLGRPGRTATKAENSCYPY